MACGVSNHVWEFQDLLAQMNRRERRRRKRERKRIEAQLKKAISEQGRQPPEKQYFSKTISAAKLFWGVIAAIIALLGGWAILKPIVHVDPYIHLNPSSPFSERFKLSNDGSFAIYDVHYDCILADARTTHGSRVDHMVIVGGDRGAIEAGQSISIDCPLDSILSINDHYISAEIAFDIQFRPTWYFWPKMKEFLFSGQLDSQGNVQWVISFK